MKNIKTLIENFIEKIKGIWQEDLVSVILYGSFLEDTFDRKTSDVNLVVLVKNVEPDKMLRSRKIVRAFHRRIRLMPLFLSADFFHSSLDSFAIEWKEIKNNYRILYGPDPVKETEIKNKDMRLQLEREIKQNIIQFQQGLLFGWQLPALVSRSAKSFRVLYRSAQALLEGDKLSPLEAGHLKKIENLQKKRFGFNRKEWELLAREHLGILNAFAQTLNRGER